MYQRDYFYWEEYYKNKLAEDQPSLFSQFVLDFIKEGESLIDLGCGNGRDALYFSCSRIRVTAMDQSPAALSAIEAADGSDIVCICGDIVKVSSHLDDVFDNAYSRFCIHALSEEQQGVFLKEVHSILKPGGRFWIEVRGTKDSLYGKGEPAGRNAFIHDGHYRRFIALDELLEELKDNGFEIVNAEESTGFAPYRGDDPVVIRVTARKL